MAGKFVLTDKAYRLAQVVHADQKRDDGQDYIEHPIAIATKIRSFDEFKDDDALIAVAFLHDTIEDTIGDKAALKRQIADEFGVDVLRSVMLLTKLKEVDYAVYIKTLIDGADRMSLLVKYFDLEHNLSDHKRGARRDKYMLAQMMIEARLQQFGYL